MNTTRFEKTFARLRTENRAALVGFITGGDPDMETSRRIIRAMCETGCDVLELGVPFSDPSADGPVIQRSSVRALKNGASLRRVMELAADVRAEFPDTPTVIFSYYNPILMYGRDAFVRDVQAFGIDGVLCVDLPLEESAELGGLPFPMIRLLAPTTSSERTRRICEAAGGFLYVISGMGVTGTRTLDFAEIEARIGSIRGVMSECGKHTPLCVGFGISTQEDVAGIAKIADGAVVGSAFEKIVETAIAADRDPVPEIAAYTRAIHTACRRSEGE